MNHAEFATRCTAIELLVDSLGDAAYQLALVCDWGDVHRALVQTCEGLHSLDEISKRTAPIPPDRVVAAAPGDAEPNRVPCTDGIAAAATTCSTPATARANAPDMDRESTSRKEGHDPLHALAVQNITERTA